MSLTLLSRRHCGLCEDAAALLRQLGLSFETVDIDGDPGLRELHNEAIPVLLFEGQEVCRAPITPESLRSALSRANLGSSKPL